MRGKWSRDGRKLFFNLAECEIFEEGWHEQNLPQAEHYLPASIPRTVIHSFSFESTEINQNFRTCGSTFPRHELEKQKAEFQMRWVRLKNSLKLQFYDSAGIWMHRADSSRQAFFAFIAAWTRHESLIKKICWFRVVVYSDQLMQLFVCLFIQIVAGGRRAHGNSSPSTDILRAPRCMFVSMLKYIFAVSINIFLCHFTISTLHGMFNTAASSQKCFFYYLCIHKMYTHRVAWENGARFMCHPRGFAF